MADLAAGNVTYALLTQRTKGDSRKQNRVQLSFGDGALTVPAGGIPLSKGKMGCPTTIESLQIVDQGTSGYVFNYDQSEEKLVVLRAPGTVPNPLSEASGVAIVAQTLEAEVIGS